MEENKYKYLVDVCGLVELTDLTTSTGCSPDESTKYSLVVKSKDRTAWNTFLDMFMRDDILFCIEPYFLQTFVLIDVDRYFNAMNHTFELTFRSTGYGLHSEFVRRLKRINSLDDIEKSHVDEPGEQGEQGVVPALNGKTPVEVNLCDIFESYEECWDIGDRMLIHAKSSQKAIEFLNSVQKNKASCEWFVSIPGHVCYYKLLVICPFDGYIRLLLEPLPWLEVGRVSFSAPTLTGPRGSQPLWQSGKPVSLCVPEPETPQAKEIVTLNMHMDVGEIHPDYSMCGLSAKSTLEREMDLIQRYKVNSYLFEREEAPKFPQMRRARLNKPKSI